MKNKVLYIYILLQIIVNSSSAQSFSEEKTSMINYVKRMYTASPFEGAKLIEGEENKYYIAAISLVITSQDSTEKIYALAESKAQEAANITFAEPCIKYEMLATIENSVSKKTTFLFSCEPLSEFIKKTYNKKPFEGAKIILAPKNNYFISVVNLDNSKYNAISIRDRVASIKAKQQANALFNGSTIRSDIIIKTDETLTGNKVQTTEIIHEQTMGFVEGLSLLSSFETAGNKTTYIFYQELKNK